MEIARAEELLAVISDTPYKTITLPREWVAETEIVADERSPEQ